MSDYDANRKVHGEVNSSMWHKFRCTTLLAIKSKPLQRKVASNPFLVKTGKQREWHSYGDESRRRSDSKSYTVDINFEGRRSAQKEAGRVLHQVGVHIGGGLSGCESLTTPSKVAQALGVPIRYENRKPQVLGIGSSHLSTDQEKKTPCKTSFQTHFWPKNHVSILVTPNFISLKIWIYASIYSFSFPLTSFLNKLSLFLFFFPWTIRTKATALHTFFVPK